MQQKEKISDEYREVENSESLLQQFSTALKDLYLNIKRFELNVFFIVVGAGLYYFPHTREVSFVPLFYGVSALFLMVGVCVRLAYEWERVPVLRLGKYRATCGPGIFFVLPVIDLVLDHLDCRVQVTDFSAEKVLTKDAVPVYVDAIIFWMVWDAAKAKLEVSNFSRAVPLSGKTALREIIGRNNLSTLLSEREAIGAELRQVLDKKTEPWGITALSVEIKDIVVPADLEYVISKEAQAERERKARIIIGEAEVEVAKQYARAAESYNENETALTLRSLNLLLETVKKEGSMILVPSDVPHLMNKAVAAGIAKTQIH